MIAGKIHDARLGPRFELEWFARTRAGRMLFAKDHAPLLEKAYGRMSEMSGRAGAHMQLDMRQLHMIRAFIHENGKDNIVLLMSFLDDLAKLGIAEEFRSPIKTGESAGGERRTKHIWEILTENGFYGENGMTVHAEEYVRRSVHGFFRKR